MAQITSELKGSASQQELEISKDAMIPHDVAQSTNLDYTLSVLTDGHRAMLSNE